MGNSRSLINGHELNTSLEELINIIVIYLENICRHSTNIYFFFQIALNVTYFRHDSTQVKVFLYSQNGTVFSFMKNSLSSSNGMNLSII